MQHFADPGKYDITVTVVDASGRATTANSQAKVTSLGEGVRPDQTRDIAWWHGDQGQALIDAFNGGQSSTALAKWLTQLAFLTCTALRRARIR